MKNSFGLADVMVGLDRYRFGANYVPSKNWMAMWNAFEPDSIREDFEKLVEIGCDHVRVLLLWPAFHPLPNWISPVHLERLAQLMQIANEIGLDVNLAPLSGWISGYSYLPPFIKPESFYSDEKQQASVSSYLTEVIKVAVQFDNFIGIDLGNEFNVSFPTDDLELGDAWLKRMIALCNEMAPGRLHLIGVDHNPYFKPFSFSPATLSELDAMIVHCYPFWFGAFDRYPPEHPLNQDAPRYLARLTRAYARDAQKPVWLQEWGQSEISWPADDIPGYLNRTARGAIDEGVCWFTWWCSHEVPREIEFHPFEYDLGLLTVENDIKRTGRVFAELAREFAGKPVDLDRAVAPAPPARLDSESVWKWLEEQSS